MTEKKSSEALKDSEQRYRSLFENMLDGYAHCRMIFENDQPWDYSYLDVNLAFEKLTGLKDVIGKKVSEVIPGIRESNPELFEIYGKVALTGRPERFETFVVPLKIWLSISVYCPEVGTFTAVFENITARKQAEEALRRNEMRLESLLEISNYEAVSHQHLLEFALKKAIDLTGSQIGYIYHYDEQRQQFTLNNWSREVMDQCNILDPQTVYFLDKTGIWGEAVRQRQPIIVNDYSAYNPLKKGCPPGHAPLRSFLTVPVFVAGRIVAVIGVANKDSDYDSADVLQLTLLADTVWKVVGRRESERALQQSEQRFRAMFEGHQAVMLMIEPESGRIVDANPGAASFYGYSREILRRMNISDINQLPPQQVSKERRRAMNLESTHFIFPHKLAGGEVRTVEVHSTPVIIHDQPLLFSIIHDITDRKRAEDRVIELNASLLLRASELEAVNKELEAFGYSVSHDLRAPLRTLDGFSQVVLEDYSDKLDSRGREYLQLIRTASQEMGQLIEHILNLSRIARSEVHLEKVDLSELAREVADELKRSNPQRRVEFEIAPGLKAYGDRRLLKVVFENLLGNAFKFTGKRPLARIEFGVAQFEGAPAYFIKDNGAGFDMAYSDKLFAPFQRLHSREEFEGTGIGLASVQNIIRRLGGKVWAEGEKDRGAVFYFTLQPVVSLP